MNRRDFIKGTALAAGAVSIGAQAAEKRVIRAAIVGCGGRGRGAMHNMVEAANQGA